MRAQACDIIDRQNLEVTALQSRIQSNNLTVSTAAEDFQRELTHMIAEAKNLGAYDSKGLSVEEQLRELLNSCQEDLQAFSDRLDYNEKMF